MANTSISIKNKIDKNNTTITKLKKENNELTVTNSGS